MGKDILFDMAWQPVPAWPRLKKDEVICIPSVSVQCKVLPTEKGSRSCKQHVGKASSRAKNINSLQNEEQKKKVPMDL